MMGAPQTESKTDSHVSPPGHAFAFDSDWEYEYDERQTEDFYFTLDLPDYAAPPAKRRKTETEKAAVDEVPVPNDDSPAPTYLTRGHTRQQPQGGASVPAEGVHFSDLHTTTPTVERGGMHYECQWTTDLGTQFHVSQPDVIKQPFRAGRVMDVVALTRVRLTGKHPKPPPPPPATVDGVNGASAGHAIVLDDDEGPPGSGTPAPERTADSSSTAFLVRVAQIQRNKAKRSEQPMSGTSHAQAAQPTTIVALSSTHREKAAANNDSKALPVSLVDYTAHPQPTPSADPVDQEASAGTRNSLPSAISRALPVPAGGGEVGLETAANGTEEPPTREPT